jgi:lysine 2,3-aminomutase
VNTNTHLPDGLSSDERSAVNALQTIYPFKITTEYLSMIDWNTPDDPLRRQIVPSLLEMRTAPHESPDPLDERSHIKTPGLIHKYSGRALWLVTHTCPVHCRFCFRRWTESGREDTSPERIRRNLESVLRYLEKNPGIFEIILSGGDPFCLELDVLNDVLERLNAVPTIRHIRIHTRMPVVAWENEKLMKPLVTGSSAVTRIVLHINHPREIGPGLNRFINHVLRSRIPVLSQSVLLAGVNDDENTLFHLFSGLINMRIQPYYLHLLDAAPGTDHFRVPENRARALMKKIHTLLPGHAVPKLVRDIPGRGAKTIL